MLYEIMKHIRNFFQVGYCEGTWEIVEGTISLPFLHEGQYYLIEGSVFNNGVHCYTEEMLTDEKFTGCITALAPPKAFLDMVEEIETFQAKNGDGGQFSSESFGGYSYTRATNADGNSATWKDVFQSRLNTWRKL